MAGPRRPTERERAAEARRAIERASDEAEVVGTSRLVRAADRARGHFGAADRDPGDRIELWGTRIGRALGLVAFVALAVYLVVAYVL